ncbi:oocyte zinc finger protein XlCOF7.1-like isoform X2 [Hyperolius riggenbachi]|uniref:oocyte zinc finger protein XlCOF7.1-like isoform X2 n=1 Tax=Hyperolius riggenbachi TaxID=752182 RepID=UPI0035A387B2
MSMEGEKSHMTERILNLTLEIIYLLTGENYIAFKLSDGLVTPKLRFQSDQSSNAQTPPISSIPQGNNKKKIQDVTSEMIELLTGEVPIRCQDVSVYFSMEEWQYLEGHKDLYKDIMVENQQPFILPNGSRNQNPPQRSAGPLHPQDCTQEHYIDQGEHCININLKETKREEMDLATDMKCKMQEGSRAASSNRNSPKRRTGPFYSQEYAQENHPVPQPRQGDNVIKVVVKEEEEESYMEGNELCKQENILPEISTGFSEENAISQDPHEGAHCSELSSDYCTRGDEETLLDEQCLNDHPSASGSDETFPCPMCGGCFSQRAGININTGDMLYSCSKCGKCFTPKQRLIEQMRTNSGPKPYSCPQCRKGFPSKAHLVIHYRLHTGEKPYTCSECGKCFHQKSNLNHHQVIHLGEKPFSCLECGKPFLRKADLVTHQKTHMGLKPYSCPHCGKCYRSKSTVLKHQRIHMG